MQEGNSPAPARTNNGSPKQHFKRWFKRVKRPRVKIFVDGANVFYSQKKMGWSVEWAKFCAWAKREWRVDGIKYYAAIKQDDERMAAYLRYLNSLGIETFTKPLKEVQISPDHPAAQEYGYSVIHKANFDVEMTTDILLERETLNKIVMITGDSDFCYLIQKMQSKGHQVVVIASQQTLSHELKVNADEVIPLEDLKEKLEKEIEDEKPKPI